MERHQVISAAIRSIGYDERREMLDIEFRSGLVYRYFDVPEPVFRHFLGADSKGRFHNAHIRGAFPCARMVTEPDRRPIRWRPEPSSS